MICPECGAKIKVVCAACRAKRQRIGILLHQRRFLETWAGGNLELRMRGRHVELFDDRWHAFCGAELFKLPPAPTLVRELPINACTDCVAVLQQQLTLVPEIRYPAGR